MAGKILYERVLGRREYAGNTLLKKEQRFVTSKLERMEVEDINTGHTYYTQCKVYTFWKRVVEEPFNIKKGTFLEHSGCPRYYVKTVSTTPKGTKKSNKRQQKARAYSEKMHKLRDMERADELSKLLVNTKKPVFMGGKLHNPIKLNISADTLNKVKGL